MKTLICMILLVFSIGPGISEESTTTGGFSTSSDSPIPTEETDNNITEGTTETPAITTEKLISSTLEPKIEQLNNYKEGKWNGMRSEYAKKHNIANMNKLIFNVSLYRDMSDVPCGENMTHYSGVRHVYWSPTVKNKIKLLTHRKGAVEGSNLGNSEKCWPTNTQFACARGKAECGLFCSFAPGGEWKYSDIVYGVAGSACGGEVEDGLCLPTTLPPKTPKVPEPSEKQSVPEGKVDEDDDDDYSDDGGENSESHDEDYSEGEKRRMVSDSGSFSVICSIATIIFALCV